MKHAGAIVATAGLALAISLYVREGVDDVLSLLSRAGWGLVLAGLVHVVPMIVNARAWQILFASGPKPPLALVSLGVWVRESVNGLLPVARIGGEIASYRLLTARGMRRVAVAASLLADMTMSVLTQAAISAVVVAYLLASGIGGNLMGDVAYGLVVLALAGIAFLWAQRGSTLESIARKIDRIVAGRFRCVIAYSSRIDRALRGIYRRWRTVLGCALWQSLAWISGALELWVELYFLGEPVDALTALTIELAIQAVSSVAFVVPAALGVQEGAFVVVGRAVGLDVSTALALAAARRVRDLVVFFPGLLFWHWHEVRGRYAHTAVRR